MFQEREVQDSPELRRIEALPRREWLPEHDEAIAELLTKRFKAHGGTQRLRAIQARAIWEAFHMRGLVGPIRVGGGKTLILFLIARMLEAKRPMLILPGGLCEKTERDYRMYSQHWALGPMPMLLSYEKLSNVSSDRLLVGGQGTVGYQPDLVLCDEAHKLKNLRAACTRRLDQYLRAYPKTVCVFLSGTLVSSSILDAAHLLSWALKEGAPIPRTRHEASEWAGALDPRSQSPLGTGALLRLAVPGDRGNLQDVARRGFRSRLLETAGVVASTDPGVACSIIVRPFEYDVSPATEEFFGPLRDEWKLPDGYRLTMATQAWAHARQLALDLHYFWNPRAPVGWLRARSEWAAYVREVLGNSRTLFSEEAVKIAVATKGFDKDGEGPGLLREWERIAPTFAANPDLQWHGTAAMEAVLKWSKKEVGIVWVEHTLFAIELAARSGMPYYGSGGFDAKGNYIEDEKGDRSIIASVGANMTGRNLQYAFSRNLITAPTSSAVMWEQLIGRTHRDGQAADEVTVDVLFGCYEHWDSVKKAIRNAQFIEQSTGHEQKLLLADINWPSSLAGRKGNRWRKNAELGKLDE